VPDYRSTSFWHIDNSYNIQAVPNMQKMQFGTAFDYLIEEKKKKLYKQKNYIS